MQVAQLAGIPKSVIASAKSKLKQLELSANPTDNFSSDTQLGLNLKDNLEHPVVEYLLETNADELSPKESLELLYKLKSLI